jgi:hypothetical protein
MNNNNIVKQSMYFFSYILDYKKYGAIIDRGSFDRKSVDRNCVFSVDQNFHNQLTKILDAFQLIESFNNEFDQLTKKNGWILAVDQIFFKA